jgi:hypothetical protein
MLACGAGVATGLAKEPNGPKTLKGLRDLQKLDEVEEDDEVSGDKYRTKIETRLIGDYTNFAGMAPIDVVGVGLVVGLSGTGGNPAPSPYRTALMEDLKRRNVRNPNEILRSPDTALVLLKAKLPPLIEKGDTIDVEVSIPDSAEATSLHGGWLMEAYLTEQMVVAGKGPLLGHHYGRAMGPVLTAAIGGNHDRAGTAVKRGRVLGGGTVTRERELAIYLRYDFRSVRNAIRIADAISKRFHDYDKHGIQKPMATPKNDQKIVLAVHPRYKNNFPRYLQVIRSIAFNENTPARRLRMQRLKDELRVAETSEAAALQLEALGKEAAPVLKAGLESPLLECRFQAATALAYLGEPDGVAVLAEAARDEPAFRVYALAALSVIDDAEAHLALRGLMNESSMETRYGAFRALWVLDKNDPFIRGELIKSLEGKTGFLLHPLQTQGEPMVHLTTRTRPEVVLFGADQAFTVPLFLAAGKHIMVTAQAGAQTASVVKFSPDRPDERREVSLKVADVIRAACELNATYPDIVQMLTEAAAQNNLPGRFAHDALPEAGRLYERPAPAEGIAGKGSRKARIGRDNLTPNLFPLDPTKLDRSDDDTAEGMANVPGEAKMPAQSGASAEGSDQKRTGADGEKSDARQKSARKSSESRALSRWPSWLAPRVHRFETPEEGAAKASTPIDVPSTPPKTAGNVEPAEPR